MSDTVDGLRLHLLGGFQVECGRDGAAAARAISSKKAKGLLAYLSLNRPGPVPREKLATLLWEDRADAQARQSLRQCIAVLRRELQNGGPELLLTQGDCISLPRDLLWVDVAQFEADAASNDIEALRRAADLYGGDFLADLNVGGETFDEWVSQQRSRLSHLAGDVLQRLAAAEDKLGEGDKAIAAAQRLVDLDPLREDGHRLLIRLLARYRGRAAAMRQYELCAAVLRRELDVEPEPETTALIAEIQDVPLAGPFGGPTSGAAAVGPTVEAPPSASHGRMAYWVPALTVVLLAAVAALAWQVSRPTSEPALSDARQDAPPLPTGRMTIAVLPFVSHGADEQDFAATLSDELTTDLSRYPAVDVAPRRTALAIADERLDAKEIGRRLGVAYLLDGSVRVVDGRLRINVQLVDAITGVQLWADRFERDEAERVEIQNDVLARLGRSLHVEMTQAESRRIQQTDAGTPASLDDLLMRAWAATTTKAPAQARARFEAVLAKFPESAGAREGAAWMHALEVLNMGSADPVAQLATAEQLIEEAAIKRPRSARVYFVRGLVFAAQGRHQEAIAALEQSLSLNHGYAMAHAVIGDVKLRLGRPEEALADIEHAMRINPQDRALAGWLSTAGHAYLLLGKYEIAIEHLRRSVAVRPESNQPWALLAAAETLRGNVDAARAAADELKRRLPGFRAERFAAANPSENAVYQERSRRVYDAMRLAFDEPASARIN